MAEGPHGVTKARALISSMLLNLIIGSYYAYGNYNNYIANYLISKGNHIDTSDTLVIQPIWLILQSVSTAFSIKVANMIGYRMVNWVAFLTIALCNLLCSYITNYYAYVIVYSVMNGIGCGLGYLMGIYISWTYFPEKKSIITGSILFMAGISASILSPLTTWIVNPNNLPEDSPEVYNNVPMMFKAMAALFAGITIVSGIILPPPYESKEVKAQLKRMKTIKKMNKQQFEPGNPSLITIENKVSVDSSLEDHDADLMEQKAIINRYNASRELDTILADETIRLIGQLDDARVSGVLKFGADEEIDYSESKIFIYVRQVYKTSF